MRSIKLFAALILLCFALAGRSAQVSFAQAQFQDLPVDYTFGGMITFQTDLQPPAQAKEATIFIRLPNNEGGITDQARLGTEGKIIYQYDAASKPLRAFSILDYWFRVTLQDGMVIDSPVQTFTYRDNRYAWQLLESGPFHIYWYDGDRAFGQSILDVAQQGLQQKIQTILPLPAPRLVDIYVYATPKEMQSTFQISGQNWAAGHAEPDLGVMLVSLPDTPEGKLETRQQVPHELMHIMLYQVLGAGYDHLPLWLNEGLASMAELSPNPDWQAWLQNAVRDKKLIPLSSLCQSYPSDMAGVYLFYSEAESFTQYLYNQYGSSGLESLVVSYANGESCEQGAQKALGLTLTQLESKWLKHSFGQTTMSDVIAELSPWFIVLAVAVFTPLLLFLSTVRRPQKLAEPGLKT